MKIYSLAILLSICALSALILLLYLFALKYYLYWTIWWYDIMMHFLGGCIISAVSLWVYGRFFQKRVLAHEMIVVTLTTIIIVGVGWEVFEYSAGMMVPGDGLLTDTLIDLLMDLVGSVVACIGMYMILKRKLVAETLTPHE